MPESIKTLSELGFMYGTDKTDHGYLPFYEKYLPKNPKKILEVGVKEGRSVKMWLHYFPEAEVHGMDLFKEFPVPFTDPRVKWWTGHQADYYLLEQLAKQDYDLIVDDGSHVARHQLMTFGGLFNGKHYFIEDLHCNFDPFYLEGLPDAATPYSLFGNDFLQGLETIRGTNIILIKCS